MDTVGNRVPDLAFLGSVHEGIPVRDEDSLQSCVRFYTEVLGLSYASVVYVSLLAATRVVQSQRWQ